MFDGLAHGVRGQTERQLHCIEVFRRWMRAGNFRRLVLPLLAPRAGSADAGPQTLDTVQPVGFTVVLRPHGALQQQLTALNLNLLLRSLWCASAQGDTQRASTSGSGSVPYHMSSEKSFAGAFMYGAWQRGRAVDTPRYGDALATAVSIQVRIQPRQAEPSGVSRRVLSQGGRVRQRAGKLHKLHRSTCPFLSLLIDQVIDPAIE